MKVIDGFEYPTEIEDWLKIPTIKALYDNKLIGFVDMCDGSQRPTGRIFTLSTKHLNL